MSTYPSSGIEYKLLLISILLSAVGLVVTLVTLTNGVSDIGAIALPLALLLVSVPVTLTLSFYVQKLERQSPDLMRSQSKQQSAKFGQVIAFGVGLLSLTGFIYGVFLAVAGQLNISFGHMVLDALFPFLAAVGVFSYYRWVDRNAGHG